MDLGLFGKRAAVAAGSAGLGLGTARALAAEGVQVAICGRDAGRLATAAESIPGDVVTIVADVADAEQARGFVRQAIDRLGGLDVLVANAGGPPAGTFASTPFEAYAKALELNLLSTVAMCEVAVPVLVAQGWGRILAITSSTVRQPAPNLILSNVARSGATAFCKTLALEVAGAGVTVNTIQPGLHDTDRLAHLGVEPAKLARAVPAGFIGDADDFGAVAAFLCSEPARYVTGVSVPVDGGVFVGLQ
jgi:3-oxoacyl-[acyl-carrier protein] reductase